MGSDEANAVEILDVGRGWRLEAEAGSGEMRNTEFLSGGYGMCHSNFLLLMVRGGIFGALATKSRSFDPALPSWDLGSFFECRELSHLLLPIQQYFSIVANQMCLRVLCHSFERRYGCSFLSKSLQG